MGEREAHSPGVIGLRVHFPTGGYSQDGVITVTGKEPFKIVKEIKKKNERKNQRPGKDSVFLAS